MEKYSKDLMVSVWCLVYNHEPYLRRCLEGFVTQQTSFHFEVVVHDDCSTDNSAVIIKEYEMRYPDIIKPIYEKENQYSKHNGTLDRIYNEAMKGRYVAICEGDDCWTDTLKLQKQIDYLEKNSSVNITTHNAIKQYSDGKNELFNKDVKSGVYSLRKCLYMRWFTPTASYVYRNNFSLSPLWTKNGSNGDMAILFSNLMKGGLYYFDEVMSIYNYRTPSSLSSSTPRSILYKKKRGMLKTINQLSNNKYILSTFPLYILLYIKQIIWCLFNKECR